METMEFEYNEDKEELLKKFDKCNDLKQIKIKNIPLTVDAMKLFKNQLFLDKLSCLQSLHTINLIVEEEINENQLELLFATSLDNKLLITINSKNSENVHFFWKLEGSSKHFESLIFDCSNKALYSFTTKFLTDSLQNNHAGEFYLI